MAKYLKCKELEETDGCAVGWRSLDMLFEEYENYRCNSTFISILSAFKVH